MDNRRIELPTDGHRSLTGPVRVNSSIPDTALPAAGLSDNSKNGDSQPATAKTSRAVSRFHRHVAIQWNPRSGWFSSRPQVLRLLKRLKQHGIRGHVFGDRKRLAEFVKTSLMPVSCLVAVGGDGTVDDVINRYPGFPLAVLPYGTENLLSKYLRLPFKGAALADLIAADKSITLDTGLFESPGVPATRFAVMLSIGFDAEVIHRAHAARTGHISRLAYVRHIFSTLLWFNTPELQVFVDNDPTPSRASMVIVQNLPMYALGLPISPLACENDGLLDVTLLEHGSAWSMLRYFVSLVCGFWTSLSDVRQMRVRTLRVISSNGAAAPVQVDGDPAGFTPVSVSVTPAALKVVFDPAKPPRTAHSPELWKQAHA